jgi:ribosome biogenesis protein BMS1
MFSSALEVAKFEHAKIKTVSGIRGSIKKAVNAKNDVKGSIKGKSSSNGNDEDEAEARHQEISLGRCPPGTFRATFEDKILMSDIVICRLWVPVDIKKFYNPIVSLLASADSMAPKKPLISIKENGEEEGEPEEEERESGVGGEGDGLMVMRTTSQLRKDLSVPQKTNPDSVYKPIERQTREFSKLKIPKNLQMSLPYSSKPKFTKGINPSSYLARRAVIVEPEERKQRNLIQVLSTIKKDKETKRKVANKERAATKLKEKIRENEKFSDIQKSQKKRKYREEGLEKQRKMKKMEK